MFYLVIIGIFFVIWLLLKYIFSYWNRNGFHQIEPSIPMGNLNSVLKRERSFGLAIYDLYLASKKPFIGIYLSFRPALLICDAELSKNILTKDFSSFHDRGVYVDKNDPFSQNLFALQGQEWKTLRTNLNPTFTSGKLKNMFSTIKLTGESMQNHLNSILPNEGFKVIEMKDILTRYSVDIIGSTIFGLDVNSFENPKNDFFEIRGKINNPSLMSTLQVVGTFLCPSLAKFMKIFRVRDPISEFMVNIVKQTIEYREKNNYVRKDLMQSLIQLRNSGVINADDENWNINKTKENIKSMSIEQCAAQAFLFYIAGLETSAAVTSFCLYELSQNEDILKKVENDIENAIKKHDGNITYDAIQDMKYLDLCIKETTRKYPGLPILNRECTKDYQIPGTETVIKRGTAIVISAMGLHRDEKYFPNPLKFDPERFRDGLDEKPYNESAFIPFGDGPRHCIGLRLGKINIQMGLVMILTKFNIEAVEKKEIEFDSYSVGLMPKGGINIKLSKK